MEFVQPGVDDLRASGSEARAVDAPCQPSAGHFGRLATGGMICATDAAGSATVDETS